MRRNPTVLHARTALLNLPTTQGSAGKPAWPLLLSKLRLRSASELMRKIAHRIQKEVPRPGTPFWILLALMRCAANSIGPIYQK